MADNDNSSSDELSSKTPNSELYSALHCKDSLISNPKDLKCPVANATELRAEEKKVLEKGLSDPWFDLIKTGVKKIEGKLYQGDVLKMKVGDLIIWKRNGTKETFTTKVKDIRIWGKGKDMKEALREMLDKEGLDKVLPCKEIITIEDGVKLYCTYFKKGYEGKGVAAIELVVVQ